MSDPLRGKVSHILSDHVNEYLEKTANSVTALVTSGESNEETVRQAIEQAIGNPDMNAILPKLTSTVLRSVKDEKSAKILGEVRSKVHNTLVGCAMEYHDETVDAIVALASGDESDEKVVSGRIAYVMSDPDIEGYVLPDLTSIVVNAVKTRKSMGMPNALRTKVSQALSKYANEYLDKTVDSVTALSIGDDSDEQTIRDAIEHAIGDPNFGALLPKLTSIIVGSTKARKSAKISDALRSEVFNTMTDHFNSGLEAAVDYIVSLSTLDEVADKKLIKQLIGDVISDAESHKLLSKLESSVIDAIRAKKQIMVRSGESGSLEDIASGG